MKTEQHKVASDKHFLIAQGVDKEIASETDEDKKLALITVAAQNYFYAGINAIEHVFSKLKQPVHSIDHKSRMSNIYTNVNHFESKDIYFLYKSISNETRRQVAYRAVNGSKYKKLKKFAETARGEIK